MNLFNRRRAMMAAVSVLKKFIVTAVSGIVTFLTNVVHTTKVVCEFSPVQSGTGDPSPSNVRSISGWNGCEIHQNGKNLLKNTAQSTTVQGITYTVNSDGSVTANGTATGNANFYFSNNAQNSVPSGNYKIIGVGTTNNFMMTSSRRIGNSYHYADSKSGLPSSDLAINDNVVAWAIYLHTSSGVTLNNVTIYPMIVVSEETDYTYEAYKESTKSINWQTVTHNLPSTYQEVEYLESTKDGQYIDTLESVTDNTSIRIKFRFLQDYYLNYMSAFGAQANGFGVQINGRNFSASVWSGLNTITPTDGLYVDTECEMSKTSITVNGTTTALTAGNTTPTGTIWLFGKQRANSNLMDVRAGTRIYYAEIYSGSTLVKSFVPCYRKSDDVIGMYETVNGVFYTNQGLNTTFVKGNDVPGTVYGGTVTLNEDGSADLVVIDGYIASYDGETLSNHYISSQAAPNTTPVTGSQVFDFGADTDTYHFSSIGALESFVGTNSGWHDMNGSITVEYYKNT